ncbi:MAG: hypothetical protein AAF235_03350, partial [Planctomycetota bacterium]
PAAVLDASLGWPRLRWAQRFEPATVKPAVAVLAEAIPATDAVSPRGDDQANPLVLAMRFGAGNVIYVATDEMWRWRYGRGETLYERFWTPLIRSVGRGAITRGKDAAVLAVEPSSALVGQTMTITLELFDPGVVEAAPDRVEVIITGTGAGAAAGTERNPGAGLPVGSVDLRRDRSIGGTRAVFSGAWTAANSGAYSAVLEDPSLAVRGVETAFVVARANDELRRPQADHAMLRDLVAATPNGGVLAPGEFAELPSRLPNRSRVSIGSREVETLWDRPLTLGVLIVLFGLEWIGRRLLKLA